jgi:WD40 repeat protein
MKDALTPLIELEHNVASFDIDADRIYMLYDNAIVVLEQSGEVALDEYKLFAKDGKARKLIVDDRYVYCSDFCTLHILDKTTLFPVKTLTLGRDLSSDICTMQSDGHRLFVSVRNGALVGIDLSDFGIESHQVSDTSMWSFVIHGDCIYAGTVGGNLLVIDTDSLEVVREIESGKKNVRSVMIDGDDVITASQDRKLVVRDLTSLETVAALRNVHNGMFDIAGCAGGKLYTVSHPRGELKAWDRTSLELFDTLRFREGLTGDVRIDAGRLYLSSRNVAGLLYLDRA